MADSPSAAGLAGAAETAVVALARAGDSEAFDEIVRRRHRQVRHFMRRLCNHPDQGDDLAQQVFLKAWRSLHGLQSTAAFGTWLRRIMVTTWLEHVRRRQVQTADVDPDSVAVSHDMTRERIDLDAALAKLPDAMRLCVLLAYNDGLTHGEIAALTDLPLGTVKSYISRGAARLRDALSAYGPNG